jgi:phosphoribosylformylglycinamidine synthase
LKALLGTNYAAKQWVYEQYDSQVIAHPRTGLGAGIVITTVLAFTSDVTPRYVMASEKTDGAQAVAEAYPT